MNSSVLPRNTSTSQRNYGLDALKIVATIFIVFHHYQMATNISFSNGFNYHGGEKFYYGYLVELFFIISGYLMCRHLPKIENGLITLKDWYIKRASRLLPVVAVSVVVYEVLLWQHNHWCDYCTVCEGNKLDFWGSIITSLGLQCYGSFTYPRINMPLWYISMLLFCYILIYLLTRISVYFKFHPSYSYIFMVLLGCFALNNQISVPYLEWYSSRSYICVFWGLLLGKYVKSHAIGKKTACVCLLVILIYGYMLLNHYSLIANSQQMLLIFVVYPAMVLLTETNLSKKLFRHRFWGTWSQYSYNVYVWHWPMTLAMFGIMHFLNAEHYFEYRSTMYVLCLATEFLGVISHYFIEKPLNGWITKNIN